MNRTGLFAATLILALLAPAGYTTRATGSSAAVVFEWNQILQDSFPTQGVGTVRPFSLTHIAMFDAINAIEREFEPYHVRLRDASGSPAAAAAQAGHDVLVGLNPAAAATYDAALARQLGSRPSGFTRHLLFARLEVLRGCSQLVEPAPDRLCRPASTESPFGHQSPTARNVGDWSG